MPHTSAPVRLYCSALMQGNVETDILCCLKSVSSTLSRRLAKLCMVLQNNHTPRSDRPENARPEVGVVLHVVTAVVRTVVRTIGRRRVRVVEHPAGDSKTNSDSNRIQPYSLSRPPCIAWHRKLLFFGGDSSGGGVAAPRPPPFSGISMAPLGPWICESALRA